MSPPRLDLIAHLREQIARDPAAYANPGKLAACVGKVLRDVDAARAVAPGQHDDDHPEPTEADDDPER